MTMQQALQYNPLLLQYQLVSYQTKQKKKYKIKINLDLLQYNSTSTGRLRGTVQLVRDRVSSLKYVGRLSTDSLSVHGVLISLSTTEPHYNEVPWYRKNFSL